MRPALACALALGALVAVAASPAKADGTTLNHGTRNCDRAAMARDADSGPPRLIASALTTGDIARAMQPADHSCVGYALGRATSRATVSWESPADRTRFSVTPTRTYESMAGELCRDYVMTAALAKGPLRDENSACRNKDGAWHLTVHNGTPVPPGAAVLQASTLAEAAAPVPSTPAPNTPKAKKAKKATPQ
jgi:surface antigen